MNKRGQKNLKRKRKRQHLNKMKNTRSVNMKFNVDVDGTTKQVKVNKTLLAREAMLKQMEVQVNQELKKKASKEKKDETTISEG